MLCSASALPQRIAMNSLVEVCQQHLIAALRARIQAIEQIIGQRFGFEIAEYEHATAFFAHHWPQLNQPRKLRKDRHARVRAIHCLAKKMSRRQDNSDMAYPGRCQGVSSIPQVQRRKLSMIDPQA